MRLVIALIALLLMAAPTALAQDPHGEFGQGHDAWHEGFYSQLVTPETKVSCCSLADCRPTDGRQVGDHYEVEIGKNQWVRVLPSKVVKTTAPDWGFHVCAPQRFDGNPEHVYCVVLPPEN